MPSVEVSISNLRIPLEHMMETSYHLSRVRSDTSRSSCFSDKRKCVSKWSKRGQHVVDERNAKWWTKTSKCWSSRAERASTQWPQPAHSRESRPCTMTCEWHVDYSKVSCESHETWISRFANQEPYHRWSPIPSERHHHHARHHSTPLVRPHLRVNESNHQPHDMTRLMFYLSSSDDLSGWPLPIHSGLQKWINPSLAFINMCTTFGQKCSKP